MLISAPIHENTEQHPINCQAWVKAQTTVDILCSSSKGTNVFVRLAAFWVRPQDLVCRIILNVLSCGRVRDSNKLALNWELQHLCNEHHLTACYFFILKNRTSLSGDIIMIADGHVSPCSEWVHVLIANVARVMRCINCLFKKPNLRGKYASRS